MVTFDDILFLSKTNRFDGFGYLMAANMLPTEPGDQSYYQPANHGHRYHEQPKCVLRRRTVCRQLEEQGRDEAAEVQQEIGVDSAQYSTGSNDETDAHKHG